ncbi:hypothetical protein CGLAMM_00505 [Acetobacteraceae bacterium EV16G]|uniref:Phosphohistidine phosphatase n=1 Tax=Sorlinia euscelidii TaxID=3081148 RepID=A0ABU7U2R5_9PROT
MQRYLILIRHAEASQNFGTPDLDRALSTNGEAQAQSVAKWVTPFLDADRRHIQFIISPALRTRQTAQALFQRYGCRENCVYDPTLYQTDENGIWRLVNEAGDAPSHLVIIGHNPALGRFVRGVAQPAASNNGESDLELSAFAPSSCCVMVTRTDWSALRPQDLTIHAFRDSAAEDAR